MLLNRLPLSLAVVIVVGVGKAEPGPLRFAITYDKKVTAAPFTGRVFVMLQKKAFSELPKGLNWFQPEPIFAKDVQDWRPGEVLVLGDDVLAYPKPLTKLPKGTYSLVAVMDFGLSRRFSAADGNGYSSILRRELDPQQSGTIKLHIDRIYRAPPFAETERVKLVDIESRLLSRFHGRPIHMHAGVVLPRSFAREKEKRYPVIYVIPGFSGTHFGALSAVKRNPTVIDGIETLYVVLDPSCPLGHCVFADSANNGPWGQALVEELIPVIEKRYRGLGTPAARFVTGHSSGGWSSLWLQITYPDFFGGVWSTAPDSIDFRDFQLVNIYKDENIFFDATGKPRPLARRNGKVVLTYKPFSDMEVVMGHGGQLGSFEAVFSPRGPDGRPQPLWDRQTGKIDHEVAEHWKKYDIHLILKRNWPKLEAKLRGKIHVYMGGVDTFYLDGPVRRLQAMLAEFKSDAVVEIFPDRDHGNLLDESLRARIRREMAETLRKHLPRRFGEAE